MTSRVMPLYNQPPINTYQSYPYPHNAPVSPGLVPESYHNFPQQPNGNAFRHQPYTLNPQQNTPINPVIERRNHLVNPNQRQNVRSVSPIVIENRANISQVPIQRNNYHNLALSYQNYPPREYSPVYEAPHHPQYHQTNLYNQPSTNLYSQPQINQIQNPYSNPNVFPPYQPSPYSNLPSQYYQPMGQGFVPLYTPTHGLNNYPNLTGMQYNRQIPEESLNSNFNYQQANFDVNYSVEQNLVHCVICNQTYKANQKRQHLQLHRQKARNVNIRPVDEQQLKRLEKYNKMTKKGLIVKPIVEPDEFNVQYNPNQFVLKKVTHYKDVDAPLLNTIQIQTDNPHQEGSNGAYQSPNRSSRPSSPERQPNYENNSNSRMQNNRITNTRFNNDSVREQEKIFLSDKLNDSRGPHGQSFNENYHLNQYRNTDRRSESPSQSSRLKNKAESESLPPSELGYRNPQQSLNYRDAQSIENTSRISMPVNQGDSFRNGNESASYKKGSRVAQIPLRQIIQQAQRGSDY